MFFNLQGIHTAPLGMNDFFYGVLVVIMIVLISSSKKAKLLKTKGNEHYKFYMWNIYFKMFFALVYGSIYMFYYEGGDTMAYWKGAEKLNNLMWESPINYWTEMLSSPSAESIILRFTSETGYPPIWIYSDPGSFFVSKIISVFMAVFGQSYVVLTLVFGYLTAIASWKVYELVRFYKITTDWFAAISILFVPSVAFWCAGISKDTVVLISVFYILHLLFGLANKTIDKKLQSLIMIYLFGLVLFQARTFMLFTVIAPMAVAMTTRFTKRYKDSMIFSNLIRLMIVSLGVLGFLFFLKSQGEEFAKTTDKYLTEAQLQQSDFANNDSYGDKRYDLGITDYSPFGMLSVAPQAIFTAIYRPGLWEARSPLLLISGLETAVFMYLTLLFLFKGKVSKKIKFIRYNELLVFSFMFALILAFFAGFTSGLFGVLVRFKAPFLPFLLIIFTTNSKTIEENFEENPLELNEAN